MKYFAPILLTLAVVHSIAAQTAAVVGQPLPKWQRGWLDIHQISTGKGNSALLIMPDGTTMLVDAGDAMDAVPDTDAHPNASRSPAEFVARYVKRHMPDSAVRVDYALLTHLHVDHMGQSTAQSPLSPDGAYRMSGITSVGTVVGFGTMIDRGWPDYAYPQPITDSATANYRRFLAARSAHGMRVERFRAGAGNQIRLQHDAARYADFEVRNIVGNGDVWTGTGEERRATFPPLAQLAAADYPTENMCSLGIRVSFGRFRYFTGGDLQGTADPGFPAWHSVESSIASIVGPVDAQVVNHHGSMGAASDSWLRILASHVYVIPSWAPSHPAPDVLKRIVNSRYPPTERLVVATDLRESARTVIGARANALGPATGHAVIRVEPGGARYWVLVTSNRDERDVVMLVRGPFQSRGTDTR